MTEASKCFGNRDIRPIGGQRFKGLYFCGIFGFGEES